ncbi:MAG: hypothetical protein K6A32_00890 [Bacteroidales bacterium]|nr:hypothetical protein [Bacteroidales bacterium]
MNLYIRYFDDECVVRNADEALQFISTIQDFNITPEFEADFRVYAQSDMPYPKRYKVRARVYFIVIKTTASTLEEFKANGKGGAETETAPVEPRQQILRPKELLQKRLNDPMPGWYEGTVHFKRVVVVPQTGKFDYKDTTFVARVKALSPQDCYNRIIDHLRTRADVDPRSQFPSVKGKNFQYAYLGLKPYSEINV